jgi:hypothetical protein
MTWLLLAFLATPECNSVAAIDSLCKRIEKASEKLPLQKFFIAEGASWARDPSPDEVFEEAANVARLASGEWMVYTTATSDSGDWVQYVNYTFGKNGRLVKLERDLRTFIGNMQIIETLYYGCSGEQIKRSIKSLDRETKAPAKPGPEFEDRSFVRYSAVHRLPFYHLIRR